MMADWQHAVARVNALSLRERMLVLLTGLVLIGWPGYHLAWLPTWQQITQLRQTNQRLAQQQAELESSNQTLQQTLQVDPNAPVRQQLEALQRQLAALALTQQSQMADLISPEQMAERLRTLLAEASPLQLQQMSSLPVQTLPGTEKAHPLYQHGIRLQLKGDYWSLQRYLQRLEAGAGHFYWQLLDYQVQAYPQADVWLELYTLSGDKEFIRG